MCPQMLIGGEVGYYCDIFSFGVVMQEVSAKSLIMLAWLAVKLPGLMMMRSTIVTMGCGAGYYWRDGGGQEAAAAAQVLARCVGRRLR